MLGSHTRDDVLFLFIQHVLLSTCYVSGTMPQSVSTAVNKIGKVSTLMESLFQRVTGGVRVGERQTINRLKNV